jgi:hypothetical protein
MDYLIELFKGELQNNLPVRKADGSHRPTCQLIVVGNHENRRSTRYQVLKEADNLV